MVKCIASHIQPPEQSEQWLDLFREPEPSISLGKCHIRNAKLCVEAQKVFDAKVRDDTWVVRMLQVIRSGLQLDIDFQAWSKKTDLWQVKQYRSPSATAETYPIHLYHDLYIATIWNNYRSSRIHLQEVLKRCDFLVQEHPHAAKLSLENESIQAECSSIISELVSDICSSIPFCMGEIDSTGEIPKTTRILPLCGRMTLWPIYVAMTSADNDSETEVWLRSKLEYISNVMGIRLAGRLARRERRDPWDIR